MMMLGSFKDYERDLLKKEEFYESFSAIGSFTKNFNHI